jgi:predicted nucleotidyltransferase
VDFVRPIEALIPGVQGKVLAVLAATTAELNLRTIAELSGVSQAQASRVLPRLVQLGVVDRREVPPSLLFRLAPEHLMTGLLSDLRRSREIVLAEMGRCAGEFDVPPVSVIVFGSFARGEADAKSDLDVVVVRPADIDDFDDSWSDSLAEWRQQVRRFTGNPVEVLEVDASDVSSRLSSGGDVWPMVQKEGVVIFGLAIDELMGVMGG